MAKWYKGKPCFYCGRPAGTRDHITARHINDPAGKHLVPFVHLVPACERCNSFKNHLTVEQFRKWIHKKAQNRPMAKIMQREPLSRIIENSFVFYGELHPYRRGEQRASA